MSTLITRCPFDGDFDDAPPCGLELILGVGVVLELLNRLVGLDNGLLLHRLLIRVRHVARVLVETVS
jgi:hypothetical protein